MIKIKINMKYIYEFYKNLKKGQVIEIDTDTSMTIHLVDSKEFQKFKLGMKFISYGGYYEDFPCLIEVPYSGEWYVVFESLAHIIFGGEIEYDITIYDEMD